MPKKTKKARKAPENYYDMKGSVDKDKKVKQSEVFGQTKSNKKVPKGSHKMPDGSIMKDSDMKKTKKPKKKTKKKSY